MSPGSFKQDGLGWRFDLIKQRVSEWLEFKTAQLDTDAWGWEFLQSKLLWQIIKIGLCSLIAVLLVWMTWQLWLLLRPYWKRWQKENDYPKGTLRDRHSNIKTLINTPKLSVADWVARSQTARIEGNYRQGIFCLYQAMLELLDQRGIIPAQASLTDQEYQRSLSKLQVSPTQPYELLLSIHQRLCFSNAQADQALFEQCQQAYQQIEK